MPKLRSMLAIPWVYRLFSNVVGGGSRQAFIREYVKPTPGMRVLDIGCGPAAILADLPDVRYTGIDISPAYIAEAQKRYGERGTFRCEDVAETVVREPASADLVLATGVLHHLDDSSAVKLLRLAEQALAPGGRFIAWDGCFVPEQSRIARYLLRKDRGEFVRTVPAYLNLARQVFDNVESNVRHDLLRIPYTIHIMVCRRPQITTLTRDAELKLAAAFHDVA